MLDNHPLGDPDRPTYLSTYVSGLREMLDKTGEFGDFNEAISLAREALALHPVGDSGHEFFLCALAAFLSATFRKEGDPTVLDQVIAVHRDVLALCPSASYFHDLAGFLSDRFDQAGLTSDIEEAIEQMTSALKLRPPGHTDRLVSLRSLVLYREKKFKKLASKIDLADVKKLITGAIYEALESLPPRLLNIQTGALCSREALSSEFENSQEYKQLLLSATSYSALQRDGYIRDTISRYFQYVTLSHRWGIDEPLLRHIRGRAIYDMEPTDGLMKLQWFCVTAYGHGYLWTWSDTCCIDKDSTVELAKSIASMFSWYRRSALTIVHLFDVSGDDVLSSSAWLKRGWTLQSCSHHVMYCFTKKIGLSTKTAHLRTIK